jgi:hypothetical protein
MTEGERMDDATIEATRELRDDIDNILELAKETRARYEPSR